ncbi:hypothetical protein PENSUB_5737, partial [Penicillium subrubescens]
ASQHAPKATDESVTTASSGRRRRGRPRKAQRPEPQPTETGEDETSLVEGRSQEQPIVLDHQPTLQFSTEHDNFQFSAGRTFAAPPLDTIDFQPEGPSSQSSTQSRAEKARARTAKAREARARKAAERKASSDTNDTRKSARTVQAAEGANQERIESELSSELSSELGEVNMRDLERQLEAHRGDDQDYQPSSPPAQAEDSWKRKQPHSEDLSLSIRSSGKRKIYNRKSSTSRHQ